MHRPEKDDEQCYPFAVYSKDGIGRCLVAVRKIEAGEIIFVEYPSAVGPLHNTQPVCLACFKEVI